MIAFRFEELHPAVGVKIAGLDLSKELDSQSVGTLRDLFDRTGLLLVHDEGLTPQDQAYLVGILIGEAAPVDRAAAVARTHTYANYVTNKDEDGYAPFGELLFHCDMMWAEAPTEVISLYGCRVEPPTVPTRFASMVRALETLPADLRSRVVDLRAVHETGQQRRGAHKDQLVVPQHAVLRSTVKPVIWRHPRTGRELLYTSQQMTARIEGLDPVESEALSGRAVRPPCTDRRPYSITSGARVTWWYGTTLRCSTPEATLRSKGLSVRYAKSSVRYRARWESPSRRWCEPERNNRARWAHRTLAFSELLLRRSCTPIPTVRRHTSASKRGMMRDDYWSAIVGPGIASNPPGVWKSSERL